MKTIFDFKIDLTKCTETRDLEQKRYRKKKEHTNEQFVQLLFKGLWADIDEAEEYFKHAKIDRYNGYCVTEKMVNVDGTSELKLEYINNPEAEIAKFPMLKATGLCENWDTRTVECYYSESGYGFFTDKYNGRQWYFDGEWESGDARWAFEYDMRESFEVSFEDSQCGEFCKISYFFPFYDEWYNDPFFVEVEGKIYSYMPQNVVLDVEKDVIPYGVTIIRDADFEEYENLKEITIPETVTKIVNYDNEPVEMSFGKIILEGNNKKYYLDGDKLKERNTKKAVWKIDTSYYADSTINIVYDENIFEIRGDKLVKYKGNNDTVYIPNGVTTICKKAFFENSIIKRVVISKEVKVIEEANFGGCSNLEEVVFTDGIVSIKTEFAYSEKLKRIVFPESVLELDTCFEGCKKLEEVKLPNKLNKIETGLFALCESLKIVNIPDGVKSIGEGAFDGCLSLTKIVLPKNLEEVGEWAFNDCEKLIIYCHSDCEAKFSCDWNPCNRPIVEL